MYSFALHYLKATLLRTLKKPMLLIILVCIPLLGFLYKTSATESDALLVALYAEHPDAITLHTFEHLKKADSSFHFYISNSLDELKDDVSSGRCECGYVFSDTLTQMMNLGRQKNLVDLYISSNTTLSSVTNEVVYAALFEEYALEILDQYIQNESILKDTDIQASEIEALYRTHLTDGSTFSFDVEGTYSEYEGIAEGISVHVILGMIAILLLLSGFTGLIAYARDMQDRILCNFHLKSLKWAALSHIVCPLLLTGIVSAVTLAFVGYFASFLQVGLFLGYLCCILILCMLLRPLMKYSVIVLMFIPFYLIGCLLFTPIFIDLALYIDALRIIKYIFLPNILFLGL